MVEPASGGVCDVVLYVLLMICGPKKDITRAKECERIEWSKEKHHQSKRT